MHRVADQYPQGWLDPRQGIDAGAHLFGQPMRGIEEDARKHDGAHDQRNGDRVVFAKGDAVIVQPVQRGAQGAYGVETSHGPCKPRHGLAVFEWQQAGSGADDHPCGRQRCSDAHKGGRLARTGHDGLGDPHAGGPDQRTRQRHQGLAESLDGGVEVFG